MAVDAVTGVGDEIADAEGRRSEVGMMLVGLEGEVGGAGGGGVGGSGDPRGSGGAGTRGGCWGGRGLDWEKLACGWAGGGGVGAKRFELGEACIWVGLGDGVRGIDGGPGISGGKGCQLVGDAGGPKDGEVGGSLSDEARGWLGSGEGDGGWAEVVAA